MNFNYVHEVAYSVDVEDIDYYFRTDNSSTPSQGVVHHNKELIALCLCYYKQYQWESITCFKPCLYSPGECPRESFDGMGRYFIDCCGQLPMGGKVYTGDLCGGGGGKL